MSRGEQGRRPAPPHAGGTAGPRLVILAQAFIAAGLRPGDWALDATVGNGHDTLFLAGCVGALGRVYGFDVQQRALDMARERLAKAGQCEHALLIRADHARMAEHLGPVGEARFNAMMMNLGYLPGGDRGIRTRADSTLAALGTMLGRLAPGGRLTVLAYRGHPGGAAEADAVADWASGLGDRGHGVCLVTPAPSRRPPPLLACVEKGRGTAQNPAPPDTFFR